MSSESDISNSSTPNKQRITTKSQKASLIRIVKAQITLLTSNLNNDNFAKKSTDINNLIETHGEEIREHLIRYILSDVYKQCLIQNTHSPHVRLLRQHTNFSKTAESATNLRAMTSFGLALEQFCKSDISTQMDLSDLFDKLEFDSLDRVIFSTALFSKAKLRIVEQAKRIYTSHIQNAISILTTAIEKLPENALQYFLNAIAHALSDDSHQFNFEQLRIITALASQRCTNKSVIEQVQSLIALKANPEKLANDQQFKQSIIEMYTSNPSSVTRILDLVKELNVSKYPYDINHAGKLKSNIFDQAFPSILESLPLFLALDLACLADSQKHLHLESWLRERLSNQQQPQRDVCAGQCLEFLNQKIFTELQRQAGTSDTLSVPLSSEAMIVLLKVLAESHLSPQFIDAIKEIHNRCLQTFPKMIDMKAQATSAAIGAEVSFKPEIEEEANMYYERIYNGEMSIDAMIDLLKRLSISKDAKEQDIYACMIHNLFDEYAFFPKYPEKELSITSTLFGLLIQHQIIAYVPLGIALRYVLDALRNPVGSKMFNFGIRALEQFQSRLTEWPQYCTHLLQIPHFVHSQPKLATFIQQIMARQHLNSSDDISDQNENNKNHLVNTKSPIPFTCIHVPSVPKQMDEVAYSEPSSSIKDKVLFTINNLALNNLEAKIADLKEVLQPAYFKWFSNYLVVKRASSELNNHELYVLMLDLFDSKLLHS
ncbi:hypothetical protein A0J61_08503, partial [Choanephora cucurbitarum]